MPRITLIELVKYREWTEELGYDREGVIQVKQSKLYGLLQEYFWEKECFVLPFRYDYYIVLSNGLTCNTLKNIIEKIKPYTPYGVRVVSTIHKYPVIALLRAHQILGKNEFFYEDGVEDNIVIAHIDLNKVTELAVQTSIYESYLEIMTIYKYINDYAFKYAGITSYLGGDNVIAVLPIDRYEEFLNIIPSYIKVGVGIAFKARKALELAAKALKNIRSGNNVKNVLVLTDESLSQ